MGSTLHNLPSTPPVSYCTTHRLAAWAVALGSPPHLRLLVTHIWPLQGAGQSMPVLLFDYHSRLFHAYSLQWITEKWYKNKYCCALNLLFFYRTRVRSLGMLVTHWLTHSLTDWLTHSCLVNLIGVALACEDDNSKLVEIVTVAHVDNQKRVDNILVQIWKVIWS